MNKQLIQAPDILNLGISVVIIVGVVVGLGWLYSRVRINGGAGSNAITILASRGLGPKERLFIVEAGNKQLLVGMTASSIQTLHTFDRPVVADEVVRNERGFADRLRSVIKDATK